MSRSLFLAAFAFAVANSIIYDYDRIPLPPSSVLTTVHGLYGAKDGVSAFVKLNVAFEQGYSSKGVSTNSEKLQIIFLKIPDGHQKTIFGPTTMRCSKEGPDGGLIDASQIGKVRKVVNVTVKDGEGRVETQFPVMKDGTYAIVYARCHDADVLMHLDGKIEWMSEYGQLPGEYMNFLPFYGLLSTVYFLVACVWIFKLFKFSDELILLQYYIFMALALNFIETSLCFSNYLIANDTGESVDTGSLWYIAETARVLSDTCCRTLILLLCLGLGIIHERLPPTTWSGVNAFTGSYLMLKLIAHLHAGASIVPAIMLSNLPRLITLLDVVLLVWLFVALMEAEKELDNQLEKVAISSSNAELKKELYQGIRILLIMFLFVLAILFTALFSLYNILPWEYTWIPHAFEDCVVFFVTFYIAIAWMPSSTSSLYAPVTMELVDIS